MEYTIGEIAKKFNLTISQIRFYDKEGLLPEIKRVNGIRKFTDSDIETIFLIECLKKADLQLKDIKQFIEWTKEGDSSIEKRLNFFLMQREKTKAKIAAMKKALCMVEYKCWYYETAQKLGSVKALEAKKEKITPKKIKSLLKKAHKK